MADFNLELPHTQPSTHREHDWNTAAARDAYKPGIQPVFDNGARVVVGPDGMPKITVTPGLIMEMGPAGKSLQPGDLIVIPKPPDKA